MLKNILATLLACCAAAAFANVEINTANRAELEAVKGLGVHAVEKIIDERAKGSFKDWNDLTQRVGGIKNASAARLSSAGLTVNGESLQAAPSSARSKAVQGTDAAASGTQPNDR